MEVSHPATHARRPDPVDGVTLGDAGTGDHGSDGGDRPSWYDWDDDPCVYDPGRGGPRGHRPLGGARFTVTLPTESAA